MISDEKCSRCSSSFISPSPRFFFLTLNKVTVLKFLQHINSRKSCSLFIAPGGSSEREQEECLRRTEVSKNMMGFSVALLTLVSIVAFASSGSVVHYTSSGGVCQESCGNHGYGYTWCKQSGGNGGYWDYCSLEEGLDIAGKKCKTSCDFFGGSYRYCYLEDGGWNYCGLLGHKAFLEYSQENHVCLTHCQAKGGTFYCHTAHGSKRCSPFHDVTPAGLPCHENYRCSRYGHSEYRCHIDEFGWDYCGRKDLDGCEWFFYESNSSQVEICKRSDFQDEGKIIFRRERRENMYLLNHEEFKNAIHMIDKITSTTSFPDPEPSERMYFYKQEDISCKDIDYTSLELQIDASSDTGLPVAHVIYPASLNLLSVLRSALYTSLHSNFYQPTYTIVVSDDEPMLCSTDHQ
ncbi:uncharacterized protein LOC110073242 [Pogona vitticeps]